MEDKKIIIDDNLLDGICNRALESQRLRMNFNFHNSPESPAQKLLNALQPGTLIPIHRHRHTAETYIVLRGAIRVHMHDNKGEVVSSHLLDPCEGVYGIEIPAGTFHSLDVIDRNTVIFEAKDGPYFPTPEEDIIVI